MHCYSNYLYVKSCNLMNFINDMKNVTIRIGLRINKRISVNTNIKKKKTFQAFVLILKTSSGKILKYLYKNRK